VLYLHLVTSDATCISDLRLNSEVLLCCREAAWRKQGETNLGQWCICAMSTAIS